MTLDPQAKRILERIEQIGAPSLHTLSPTEARLAFKMGRMQVELEPVASVINQNLSLEGRDIPIRIYTPTGKGPFPALLYYHGGGFVVGDLDSHDGVCRRIANLSGVVVISVDYRLAPEYPFPAAHDDAYEAAVWVAQHADDLQIDPKRIAVGGDSAGGNLAATVSIRARDLGTPKLAFQLLLYPVTDFTYDTPSYLTNAEGYYLTRQNMMWFSNHYLSDELDKQNEYAAPLQAKELRNLPSAFVMTAEYDPLRDEGEAYAERLASAGVQVTLKRYPGMIHGFVSMFPLLDEGRKALEDIGEILRDALQKTSDLGGYWTAC